MLKKSSLCFVILVGGVLSWFIFPSLCHGASTTYPHGDGQVRIFNYHLDEFGEIQFRKDGALLPEGLKQANHLLRSRDNSQVTEIDPRLLDLIDYLQDHFVADTIEVISGYRRKEFNEELYKTGHSVSPVSLHTKGEALDIHIDEIREETLRDYLLSLKLGGVGYYGPLDFVHIDTGPVKSWEEPSGSRKLVGVLDPHAPIKLTSNKNDYLPGETLYFSWDLQPGVDRSKIKEVKLEHFWRGKWISCESKFFPEKNFGLPSSSLASECPNSAGGNLSPYGKFRWTFKQEGSDALLSSNEFYLKKQ
jgi:uncharacterized protein YcbK (DUF882 family)